MSAGPADYPPRWLQLLAFALAPAVAALAYAGFSPAYEGLTNYAERVGRSFPFYAVIGGYGPALVLGVPLYLALRRRVRIWRCAAASARRCSLA